MANPSAGNFLSGLLQGFGQVRARQDDAKRDEDEKKARVKLFELQLERERLNQAQQQKQQKLRDDFMAKLFPAPEQSSRTMGMPEQAPRGLIEMLAEPEVQRLAIESGSMGIGDFIPKPQEETTDVRTLRALAGDPALAAADLRRRQAGASQINLGEQGLSKPPPGFARPDPRRPGLVREQGGPPTPGQESLDKTFGQDAAAWVAAGGFADTQKSITQLGQAKAALDAVASGKSKDHLTGPLVSRLPALGKALFNPKAVAVRESVEEIVQRNLRLVLGAQFTEKEGERLIARAYNENLNEAENAKRVGRLMKQLQSAAQAKQEAVDYFSEHGTLEGFTGKVWTAADFDPEVSAGDPSEMSDEELLKELSGG